MKALQPLAREPKPKQPTLNPKPYGNIPTPSTRSFTARSISDGQILLVADLGSRSLNLLQKL